MTPLRGLFKRLKGESTSVLDSPPKTAPTGERSPRSARGNAPAPASGGGPIVTDESGEKRRRGRRGGRNRRRDSGETNDTTARINGAAPRAESTGTRSGEEDRRPRSQGNQGSQRSGRGTASGRTQTRSEGARSDESGGGTSSSGSAGRDRYQWGRRVDTSEADERSQRANRRRRDARVRNLDAPLPEDIAFRPGQAGGDSSILPNRRKRPGGLHDTARVLVGGARTVGAWVKREESAAAPTRSNGVQENVSRETFVPQPARDDEAAAAEADELALVDVAVAPTVAPGEAVPGEADEDDDGADAPRKRRRGRRGGRGRRRPSDGETTAEAETPAGAESAREPDEDDDAPTDEFDAVDEIEDDDELDDDDDLGESADDDIDDIDDIDEPDEEPAPRARAPRAPRRQALAPVADADLPPAFAQLGVSRITLESLARFGFTEPTPIQVEAIPALLKHLDVVGIAQTGSGKTVAFGTPMVERLDPNLPEVQGIVLVPTRELAQQVLEVLAELAQPWGLEAVGLLGGRSLKMDFQALDRRPHIVVGTPGRILDHLRRQTLSLRSVSYAVLDEADQMLDIGFLPDIRRILSRTPQRRQTALFSATMPTSIKRLIWQFMTDPETIRVDTESTTVDTIEQIYFEVAQRDKVRAMRELIERELKGRTLIFCNMKRSVDHLARELSRDGVQVGALHGDMEQRVRDRVVQDFRSGQLDVLIATNVAARGLDIPEITHVVNFDVPQNVEEYVHRIGRTGRAGRDGKAITFVAEWDLEPFDAIVKGVTNGISREELDLYQPNTPSSG